MPKIIENLEAKLIAEAKKQLQESGYGMLTIRSVAKGCGVGVGTVYNYFPSKDALLATFMLESWNVCMEKLQSVSEESAEPKPVLGCMYEQLLQFAEEYRYIFSDEGAASAFAGSFGRYHALLRSQLAAPMRKFCSDDFAAEFVAEAMLVWTMAGKPFDEIYGILAKILMSAVS
ncbi:MAG: TetR/AcrR family transcriptional regulator [Ruminococcaceae bacterium]|nr:TetR/AcrR family transcriptional regulator [Oscillospiraceae bacterium]